jgi:hypothetical protein
MKPFAISVIFGIVYMFTNSGDYPSTGLSLFIQSAIQLAIIVSVVNLFNRKQKQPKDHHPRP